MSVRELTADLVVDAHATLGEGARWDPRGRLYWVDITAPALHVYDPSAGTDTVVPVDRYLGAVVLRDSGGLLAAVHEGFATLDPTTGAGPAGNGSGERLGPADERRQLRSAGAVLGRLDGSG